jgi:hypothetical protein
MYLCMSTKFQSISWPGPFNHIFQAECRLLSSCTARPPDFSLPTQHLLHLRSLLLKVKPVFLLLMFSTFLPPSSSSSPSSSQEHRCKEGSVPVVTVSQDEQVTYCVIFCANAFKMAENDDFYASNGDETMLSIGSIVTDTCHLTPFLFTV